MNIETLVLKEAIRHLKDFSRVKNMDPMALHILKTSEEPLLVEMRGWMRREALRQFLEASRGQERMNTEFSKEPYSRKSSWRRSAVLHPYFAATLPQRDKTSWNDSDYIGSLKRDNPEIFPKRESI
jgi:hypothetical protein